MSARITGVATVNPLLRACVLLHTGRRGAKPILCCIATKRQMDSILNRLWLWAALLAGIAAAPFALAAGEAVQTTLEARKVVVAADGRERLVPAETAKPGDVIEYVVTSRNTGRDTVRNLSATLPIPGNTQLIEGSARPANAKASLDAQRFDYMPLVRGAVRDGRSVIEPVPAREIRYLRWSAAELAGQSSLSFGARVRVLE